MKREIKFRGFRVDEKDWVTGMLTKHYFGNVYKDAIAVFLGNNVKHHEIIPESVGQFTGLQDKNGVDIYEGDIISYNGLTSFGKPYSRTVTYDNNRAQFMADGYALTTTIEYVRIVGNIHEPINH